MGTPLFLDESIREQIKACVALAEASPIDMTTLGERIKDRKSKACRHHMAQMHRQTIFIPLAYEVTFSIEHGHPVGICRHMSMSVRREGRVPNEHAVWMIAKEFGFWGELLKDCDGIWMEELSRGGQAVNIVQHKELPLFGPLAETGTVRL